MPPRPWAVVLLVAAVHSASAQDASQPPTSVRTRVGATLSLSGLLQTDARVIAGVGSASGPIIRRAELIFEAVAPRGFSLRVQPDFGQGRVLVQDAFVRWTRLSGTDSVLVRTGRFRPTFGTERARSSATLTFPERGLVNSYMPSRAMGADVRVTRGRLAAQVGVFQPPVSASAHVVDTDGDLERTPPPRQEGLVRLEWQLRRREDGGVLRVHAGTIIGRANGRGEAATQPSRILTIGQQPVFAFQATGSDPIIADGDRWRGDIGVQSVGPRVAWHLEALEVEDGIRRRDIAHEAVKHLGFGAALSVLRGGRRAPNFTITPDAGRSAWEWGVRVGLVRVEENALAEFAEAGSASRALSGGGVISWLPSTATRLALSYDVTAIDRPRRDTEHAIIVRVQQAF
jgi:hypothetical protein